VRQRLASDRIAQREYQIERRGVGSRELTPMNRARRSSWSAGRMPALKPVNFLPPIRFSTVSAKMLRAVLRLLGSNATQDESRWLSV
jgi:hypothetical protein